MNKIPLLIALIFISLLTNAQTGYRQDLAGLASVTFPGQPETLDTLGYQFYKVNDSVSFYAVSVKTLNAETTVDEDKLAEFYDSVAKGVLGASQGKLLSRKEFKFEGLTGLEFSHTMVLGERLPDVKFIRMLLINNTLITIQFSSSSKDGHSSEKLKKQFFDSLMITADRSKLTQGVDNSIAYRFGFILGSVAFCVLILAVLAGIGFLIKKLSKLRKAR